MKKEALNHMQGSQRGYMCVCVCVMVHSLSQLWILWLYPTLFILSTDVNFIYYSVFSTITIKFTLNIVEHIS